MFVCCLVSHHRCALRGLEHATSPQCFAADSGSSFLPDSALPVLQRLQQLVQCFQGHTSSTARCVPLRLVLCECVLLVGSSLVVVVGLWLCECFACQRGLGCFVQRENPARQSPVACLLLVFSLVHTRRESGEACCLARHSACSDRTGTGKGDGMAPGINCGGNSAALLSGRVVRPSLVGVAPWHRGLGWRVVNERQSALV